jgi:allantoinase
MALSLTLASDGHESNPTNARDLRGYGREPPRLYWPTGGRIALSISVDYEEGAERSVADGDPDSEAAHPEGMTEGAVAEAGYRNLQVESLWEYGARRGIWRLLDLFNRLSIAVTVFACGRALERNPGLARALVAEGHEIAAAPYRALPSYLLSKDEEQASIRETSATISRLTGMRPSGWKSRAPTAITRTLLIRAGFDYDCDSYADDVPYWVTGADGRILVIPCGLDVGDSGFWPMDRIPGFSRPSDFTDLLDATYERLSSESKSYTKLMTITLHSRIAGKPSRIGALGEFLERVVSNDVTWIARRADVAAWWRSCESTARPGVAE